MSYKETSTGQISIADIVNVNHDFGVIGVLHGYAPLSMQSIPTYWAFNTYKSQIQSKTSVLDNNLLGRIENFTQQLYNSRDDLKTAFYNDYPEINENVVMLWGNLYDGGVGLANYDSGNCVLLGCKGVAASGNKVHSVISQTICPYTISITNANTNIDKIASMVQPTGSYENGFFIGRTYDIDYNTGNASALNEYRIYTGAITCLQSYEEQTGAIYNYYEVQFEGSAENCVFNYDSNFTNDMPNPDPLHVVDNTNYYIARSLQWKLYTLSPIVYEYTINPTVEGTNIFGGEDSEPSDDPYSPSATSTDDGGYGSPNRYSEPIQSDGVPDGGAIKTGLANLYNPSEQEMKDFASFLFSGITENISNVIKRTLTNPLDAVISSHMFHFPPHSNEFGEIRFCGFGTGCQANIVSQQFEIIDYVIDLSDPDNFMKWNSFHDLNGFTKLSIFLPYSGIHEIDVNQVYNGTLRARYKIDVLSGNCIIELNVVTPNRRGGSRFEDVIAVYTGNCACPIPLSSVDYRSIFGASLGVVASAVTGNPIGVASSLVGANMGVIKSGSVNSNMGYMGLQDPYIIEHHPEVNLPSDFSLYKGIPSDIKGYLSSFTTRGGAVYVKALPTTVWDKNVHCTDEEMNEIKDLLTNGVWIS